MHAFILQDWTTIRGGSSVTTITQGESGWLDLTPYQDLYFWLDVREASGTPSIAFQTSPTKDDSLFTAIVAATTMTSSGSPAIVKAPLSSATIPVARFVRWQINGTPTWDATFRVIVSANSPGQ
jgi:hypothetical protein